MTLHVNLVTTKHKELQNSKDDPNVLRARNGAWKTVKE